MKNNNSNKVTAEKIHFLNVFFRKHHCKSLAEESAEKMEGAFQTMLIKFQQ